MRNKMKWFFPKTYMALTVPFALMSLSILFGAGAAIGQASPEPQTTTNTNTQRNVGFQPAVEFRLVETHTVEYIEKPVTEVKYVERVTRVPIELRNYKDLHELKQWLADVNNNTTTIYFEQPDVTVDCDDFALALQRKALEDGYLMSFQIIEPSKYNSLFESSKIPANSLHAINLTIIGNNAYYIEPQTGEVVFAVQLD
ncbi:hypothetical protein ACFLWO_00275 [Chloroflexota bacterium]